jgi:hypothetical protein
MYNSDEKPKNSEQTARLLKVYRGMVLALSLCVFIGFIMLVILYQTGKSSSSLPNGTTTVDINSAQGWQPTGLRLEEGQIFTVEYLEGDWSIFPGDTFRYGPDGGASACGGTDCVQPIPRYTKSGMIGRIGDSEPFIVGSYLETTANDSGMLQLRVNDGGTHDNEGLITVRVSANN